MGCPKVAIVDINDVGPNTITVSIRDYITRDIGPGTFTSPIVASSPTRYLSSHADHIFELSHEKFDESLSSGRAPILVGTELYWSDEINSTTLYRWSTE